MNLFEILYENAFSKSISNNFFCTFFKRKISEEWFIEECHWNPFEIMTKSLFPQAIYLCVFVVINFFSSWKWFMFMHLCAQNIWCITKAASKCTRLEAIHWGAFKWAIRSYDWSSADNKEKVLEPKLNNKKKRAHWIKRRNKNRSEA